MKLEELVSSLNETELRGGARANKIQIVGDSSVEISDVVDDTRSVSAGALFCCVRGLNFDGHDLASEALENGAAALLVEKQLPLDVAQIVVPSVRTVLSSVASMFFGRPETELTLVGITGTNGKTTVVHMIDSILRAASIKSEIIGTLQGKRTTPGIIDLYRQLARHRDNGVTHIAMEVSSHGLAQGRVEGLKFVVAVFTNLTQDHLDYHKTMEEYFAAKKLLFEPERASQACVNKDDTYGARLIANPSIPTSVYSLSDASDIKYSLTETLFSWRGKPVSINLAAEHNLYNALSAATTAELMGIDVSAIVEGLHNLKHVAGRLEQIDVGQEFAVYVDFAHTPDGLARVVGALHNYVDSSERKLITIFGCGGDRDQTKRPEMGRIASEESDYVIITSDNPRSEDPDAIINDILGGISDRRYVAVEVDRREAIAVGLKMASPGDVVLIAGKGHETGQEIAGAMTPFDDRDVAREILSQMNPLPSKTGVSS